MIYQMKKLFFLPLAFAFLVSTQVFAQSPVGRFYSEAECASGGDSYYFFNNSQVVSVCSGCESSPSVQTGTYKVVDGKIQINFTTLYQGKPAGNLLFAASVNVYDKYTAAKSNIADKVEIYVSTVFETPDDCTQNGKHGYTDPSVHQFLRTSFSGKYAFASERLLTAAELTKYTKADLKIMRNEIFARYGYIFKTAEMSKYFASQPGYSGYLENVDAFLSDIENKNIALIKAAEAK